MSPGSQTKASSAASAEIFKSWNYKLNIRLVIFSQAPIQGLISLGNDAFKPAFR